MVCENTVLTSFPHPPFGRAGEGIQRAGEGIQRAGVGIQRAGVGITSPLFTYHRYPLTWLYPIFFSNSI